MGAGIPCTLGSSALFSSQAVRDQATSTYHQYEYKTLETWNELDLSAYARLAMRIFTCIPREKVLQVSKNITDKKAATTDVEEILNMPVVPKTSQSEMLGFASLIQLMLRILEEHKYFDGQIKPNDVITLLYR